MVSKDRVHRPDLPPRLDLLIRGELIAGLFLVAAAFLGLAIAFQGVATTEPVSTLVVPPIAAGLFGFGLLAMFLLQSRNGIVRVTSALGAALLAVWALRLRADVAPVRLLLFYWLPAILGLAAAIALSRTRRKLAAAAPGQRIRSN